MVGIIPRNFIDDLLDRTDIVEVIDHRVKLKKSGKNYSACCPFHDEKTPSFSVSPDKQFYYCFGCGATGNALGFLMDYERLGFPEAVENLAKSAGLEVPREHGGNPGQREREQAREKARQSLYDLLDAADQYYQQQLRSHPGKQHPINYLKRRGLDGRIVKDFGIGFAPPGWDNLSASLASSDEQQDRLLEAGMLIRNEDANRLYDRFRDRIMFPIRDTRGRVIAFGGRVLSQDAKPRYLNSPETSIFSKGRELYGLYEARQACKQLPRLLVVEGYMDVVALAQYGIRYGVATMGTACGEDHLKRAFRFTNEVVFCFDGDEAGRKAARRAMENCLPTMEDGRQVKFLYLPEGEDPDTLIRQIGVQKFSHLVEGATPLESFLFEEVGRDINIQTMEGRARLCRLVAPMLDSLPRGIYRELMFRQLSNRTQLSVDALMALLEELPPAQPGYTPANHNSTNTTGQNQDREHPDLHDPPLDSRYRQIRLSSDRRHKESGSIDRTNPNTSGQSADEMALALLLHQPKLAQTVTDLEMLRHHSGDTVKLLVELLDFLHQRPEYTSRQILGHWQGAYGSRQGEYLQQLLRKGLLFQSVAAIHQGRQDQSFDLQKEFLDAIHHLQKRQQGRDCHAIIQQLNARPVSEWTEADKQLYSQAIVDRAAKT